VETHQGGQWAGARDVQRKAEEAVFAQPAEKEKGGGDLFLVFNFLISSYEARLFSGAHRMRVIDTGCNKGNPH